MSSTNKTKRVKSTIVAVTLYESSAQVQRSAKIPLVPQGETTIEFTGLPLGVDKDTAQVQLRYEGEASCVLNGMTFDRDKGENKDDAEDNDNDNDSAARKAAEEARESNMKAVLTKMAEIDQEIQALNDDLNLEQSSNTFVSQCFDTATTTAQKEDRPEAFGNVAMWRELINQRVSSEEAMLTKRRDISKKLEELNEKKALLAAENRTLLQHATPLTLLHASAPKGEVASIHLKASADIRDLEIVLLHMTNNAKWVAEYDVRVKSETGELTLTYGALVTQHTAENWDDVSLTLSTARPQISGKQPELSPWRARLVAIQRQTKKSRSYSLRNESLSVRAHHYEADCLDDDEAEDVDFAAPGIQEAQVQQQEQHATSVTFEVPHRHTVLNTRKEVRLTLKHLSLRASYSYLTRPRLSETVFSQVKAINTSEFTLVPGNANIFLDTLFVSKTHMARVPPTDSFKVSLGVDDGVSVKYKKKVLKSHEGGMLSAKKTSENHEVNIVVKNRKNVPVQVAVEDQIPQSQDGSIEVKLIKPEYQKDTDALKKTGEGYLKMALTLKPGQEATLPVQFAVTYRATDSIDGL